MEQQIGRNVKPFLGSHRLDKGERGHLGVRQLRRFLEQLLQKRYLDSVPAIVPLLERETRNVQVQRSDISTEEWDE